jgi:hypothetical protein
MKVGHDPALHQFAAIEAVDGGDKTSSARDMFQPPQEYLRVVTVFPI